MPLQITCPHCDSSFGVSDELEGKRVRCRKCARPFQVVASVEPVDDEDDDSRPARRGARRPARRSRASRGAPAGVWVGLAVAAVLLVLVVGGGVAAFVILNRQGGFGSAGAPANTGAPGTTGGPSAPAGQAPGPRLTAANFAMLHDGISEAEVEAILGQPTERGTARFLVINGQIQCNTSTWTEGANQLQVAWHNGKFFDAAGLIDGRRLSLRTSDAPAADNLPPQSQPQPAAAQVSKANFDKLKTGMTQAQVEQILGPGRLLAGNALTQAMQTYADLQATMQLVQNAPIYEWSNGRAFIWVAYVNGGVNARCYSTGF
ncbi:MAG TPA: MJ0042-type zinc finger domain-containing protein [Gemmataceae bacterium]|nr:MJ0042-type zinc finger domain-containing protein [Gemmataceae bacterium]